MILTGISKHCRRSDGKKKNLPLGSAYIVIYNHITTKRSRIRAFRGLYYSYDFIQYSCKVGKVHGLGNIIDEGDANVLNLHGLNQQLNWSNCWFIGLTFQSTTSRLYSLNLNQSRFSNQRLDRREPCRQVRWIPFKALRSDCHAHCVR